MNAFLSWSGSRELAIALALQDWLAAVAPGLRSFVSPGLPKGRPWFDALARELQEARLGFMCLAPPRAASDWQLVEAGAIWKAARHDGLFPICFHLREADVPLPLRAFQLTHFERADFRRLAMDVARLVAPDDGWTAARDAASDAAWDALATRVALAMAEPDNGVHTTRGFIHAVAGGWWERVQSDSGRTRLSWMWFEPSNDGSRLSIDGRGFDDDGRTASRWRTDLVAVQPEGESPTLSYYWEGRHPVETALLFGGRGWLRFTLSSRGEPVSAEGEFRDVCLDQARPPTVKLVDLRRATPQAQAVMRDPQADKAPTVRQVLGQPWP